MHPFLWLSFWFACKKNTRLLVLFSSIKYSKPVSFSSKWLWKIKTWINKYLNYISYSWTFKVFIAVWSINQFNGFIILRYVLMYYDTKCTNLDLILYMIALLDTAKQDVTFPLQGPMLIIIRFSFLWISHHWCFHALML